MLVCRSRILSLSSPLSAGTFVKHLPSLKPSTSFPSRINRKTLTTTSVLKTSHFETLNPRQKEQINLYVDALLDWNQKMNLTAVREASEVMERHVEDSLAIVSPIQSSYVSHCEASCQQLSLIDVGSGAGLPGIILAIACPGWKVTLLESMNKRCIFLEHTVSLTGLSNVQVIRGRAENLGQDHAFREVFDVAVARAVAEMRILAEYCIPLVRVGGLFVAAKGHNPQEEVRMAERAIRMMGASLLQTFSGFPLNWTEVSVESHSPYGQRTAVICLKDGPTPRKYPRDPGDDDVFVIHNLSVGHSPRHEQWPCRPRVEEQGIPQGFKLTL